MLQKLKQILINIIKFPLRIFSLKQVNIVSGIKNGAINFFKWAKETFMFLALLFGYLFVSAYKRLQKTKWFKGKVERRATAIIGKLYSKLTKVNENPSSIDKVDLIELAINNMKYKMNRTIVTIGGMAIGIAAIVFLVSIGYGLQDMVISKVARLDEMKQADVSTQPGSNLKINDDTINAVKEIKEVEYVLPLIALVGKIEYQGSVSDVAVYGTTREYLDQSAIQPTHGGIFESNEISFLNSDYLGSVAGARITRIDARPKDVIRDIEFAIYPESWLRVREEPNITSETIGFTRRVEGQQIGTETFGGYYSDNDNGWFMKDEEGVWLGKWVLAKVYLWEETEDGYRPVLDDRGNQVQESGYIAEIDMNVPEINNWDIPEILGAKHTYGTDYGEVLAETDTVTTETTTNENSTYGVNEEVLSEDRASSLQDTITGAVEDISKASEEVTKQVSDRFAELGITADDEEIIAILEEEVGVDEEDRVDKVPLSSRAEKKAVVNRAMLKVLGIEENRAVGKSIKVSFIATSSLLEDNANKIESEFSEYEIVGVIPQDDVPYFYVPFIDLRTLGVTNYSQMKVVVKDQGDLPEVRQKVEAMGYITNSVTDTVEQINNLFRSLRIGLALVGTVALAVASLGMFNTLTVSLLERTREIGLMKALGMKSEEVKNLFLTESMVMGVFSGVIGIFIGVIVGELLGLILSIFSLTKGVGYIDISNAPMFFLALVIFLSLGVGIITGLYPSKRATKISALDALRYE